MYAEHRYSSTFQSAGSLARRSFAGKEKSKPEHKARVERVVGAARVAGVPEDDVGWAERVLNSRNDKTLTQSVRELVAHTGPLILAGAPSQAVFETIERRGHFAQVAGRLGETAAPPV